MKYLSWRKREALFLVSKGVFHFFLLSSLPLVTAKPSSILLQSRVLPSHHENKLSSLPWVLSSWERTDKMKDKLDSDKKSKLDAKEARYDFIVGGSGTAGSVVAARLVENSFSVLLLEAGGQPHSSHENTAMSMVMTKHPETDWMYASVPQNETCILCPEHKYTFSAGKGLGGSGNLNFLETLYEGAFQDYSEWMEATKDPAWGYYMLQPYFKTVKEYMRKKYPVSNGESQSYRSTFKALIRPVANLEIQKFAHVNKILFDDNGHAIGVEFSKHGTTSKAFAQREVIISAGTFGSPKILMLSGIGPKSELDRHNISVRANLPVGKNFQDHLTIPLGPFFRSKVPDSTFKFIDFKADKSDSWNSSTILRMPLINLNYNLYSREMSHFLGINEGAFKQYMDTSSNKFEKITGSDSMFINVALRKPISRGILSISGKDAKLKPVVNPNYLNAIYHHDSLAYSSEKQSLIKALEDTVRLMEGNLSLKSKFSEVPFPGCESYIFRGYGYWDCYIRHFSMSFNHGVGTCAMGSSNEASSVVSPELKVNGVSGLRVIDASIFPTILGTYPFQSVAVVAEKGAEMIVKEHKSKRNSEKDIESNLQQVSSSPESQLLHSPSSPRDDSINNPMEERISLEDTFSGFRIKKIAASETVKSTTTTTLAPKVNPTAPSFSKQWQKSNQIIKAYTHHVGSSLAEDDLIPPGEQPSVDPNPTHFSVKPFANAIFHPVVPQPITTTTTTSTQRPSLFNMFNFKFNF